MTWSCVRTPLVHVQESAHAERLMSPSQGRGPAARRSLIQNRKLSLIAATVHVHVHASALTGAIKSPHLRPVTCVRRSGGTWLQNHQLVAASVCSHTHTQREREIGEVIKRFPGFFIFSLNCTFKAGEAKSAQVRGHTVAVATGRRLWPPACRCDAHVRL